MIYFLLFTSSRRLHTNSSMHLLPDLKDTLSANLQWDATSFVATAIAVIGVSYYSHHRSSSSYKKERPTNLPPQASSLTSREVTQFFIRPSGVQDLLEFTRRFGHKIYEFPPFPFGTPPFYCVSDYKTARKVLEHPESKKWDVSNLFFKRTTHNGPNLVIAEGNRWKHVRKSTSTAFSATNVKLMVEQIDVIVNEWIQTVLESTAAQQEQSGDAASPISILDEMN